MHIKREQKGFYVNYYIEKGSFFRSLLINLQGNKALMHFYLFGN